MMKKDGRIVRAAGREMAIAEGMAYGDAVQSLQDKAAEASIKALDASLTAGKSAGANGYAATAMELADLAAQMNQMTGDLALALKILREVPAPAPFALDALDRLLAAKGFE